MTDRFESMRKAFNESQQNMSKEDVVEFTRKVFDYGIGREEANVSADDFVANLLTTQQKEIDGLKQQSEIIEHNQKEQVPQIIDEFISDYEADFLDGYTNQDRLLEIIIEDWKSGLTEEYARESKWIDNNFCKFCDAVRLGREVEEEPKWVVAIPMGFDPDRKNYFVGFLRGIQASMDFRRNEAFKFDDFEKAKAVALIITGNVEKEVSE